jgi:DNA-binding MarR family transcriptional regulator
MNDSMNLDRSAVFVMKAALRPFLQLGAGTIPLSMVATFLLVADRPHSTVSELSKIAGISMTKMSRQLGDLGATNRYNGPGLCLIEARMDDRDARFMRHTLTAKGQTLVEQIAAALAPRKVQA